MKNTSKISWMKRIAIVAVAVLVPTITLAEETVVAKAGAAPTLTAVVNIGDFTLPTKQVDVQVAQSIPLGEVPSGSVGGDNKIVTPAPAAVSDTEEVEVTAPAEPESQSGFPIIAAIPMAIAINAILGAIIFAGVPF